MRTLFKYLFIGLKYMVIQGLVEVILIVLLEYLGIKVLPYFSKANLFIENVEGVAWEISMKTIIFSLIYIPLFVGICALLAWKDITNNIRYSIINALLSILLFIVFHILLRHADFSEVSNLLIATILASILIVIAVKVIQNRNSES